MGGNPRGSRKLLSIIISVTVILCVCSCTAHSNGPAGFKPANVVSVIDCAGQMGLEVTPTCGIQHWNRSAKPYEW
jgi:hypothetical protein